ncbi:DUF4926 domain-containing protein [Acidithiobacillus caldus]|nr:DUF4926 domain-containing protein [Acidithiobacillus caldus]
MKLLDVVALLEPIPEQNLLRGQIGTVMEELDPGYVEVEFLVDDDYITLAVAEDRLMHCATRRTKVFARHDRRQSRHYLRAEMAVKD